MRLLLMPNNWVGWQLTQWLKQEGEQIVGVVMHPESRRRYGREILACAGVEAGQIFDGSQLNHPDVLNAIRALRADIAVSILFDYILRPAFLDSFCAGVINVHPAYLPYNRGQYPNVWSIVDGTPSGVTIHCVDAGVDTGDIIAREQVHVAPTDTGETLYRSLERHCVALFQRTWPDIRAGRAGRTPQVKGAGTVHRIVDVGEIDCIDLNRTYRAGHLIDILRARTFPPYPGAYFIEGGRRIYLRLQLLSEDDLEPEAGHGHDRD